MDYKEKYEQAIERAKAFELPEYKNIMVSIFPELAESEDEKIRKSLIGHLKECRNNTRSEVMLGEYAKWIAWLEKQGEKKPTDKVEPKTTEWSEEDERMYRGLYNLIYSTPYCDSRKELSDWLKSLRPQKQWKPSEKQIDALEHFVRSIGESGYASPCDNNTKLLYSLLEQLKKLRDE